MLIQLMSYKSSLVQCSGSQDELKRKRYCQTTVGHQSFLTYLLSLPNGKSNVKCKGNDICNTVLLALVIASRESMINLNLKMSAVLFLRASQQNIITIQWTLCSFNVWKILSYGCTGTSKLFLRFCKWLGLFDLVCHHKNVN